MPTRLTGVTGNSSPTIKPDSSNLKAADGLADR